MSTTETIEIACPTCDHRQNVLAVASANVQRFPAFRQQLIDGTFMRFACAACQQPFVVEREMLYTDLEAHLFIGVFPAARRGEVAEFEALIESVYQETFVNEPPPAVRAALGELRRRVVFGYEELREKVMCFGAGLDDRVLEVLKLMLLRARGGQEEQESLEGLEGLSGRRMHGLSLQHVTDDGALWLAPLPGAGAADPPLLRVERTVYDQLAAEGERLPLLLGPLYAGLYVHIERCGNLLTAPVS
jgi:ribosomal protein S27E